MTPGELAAELAAYEGLRVIERGPWLRVVRHPALAYLDVVVDFADGCPWLPATSSPSRPAERIEGTAAEVAEQIAYLAALPRCAGHNST